MYAPEIAMNIRAHKALTLDGKIYLYIKGPYPVQKTLDAKYVSCLKDQRKYKFKSVSNLNKHCKLCE